MTPTSNISVMTSVQIDSKWTHISQWMLCYEGGQDREKCKR